MPSADGLGGLERTPLKLPRAITAFGVGYLLGSVSFARLIGRFVAPGEDLSDNQVEMLGGATLEYGGVSATSIAMRGGPLPGIMTGVLDASKSYVPTMIAKMRWPDEPYHAFVAAGAIAGHNWPIYHGFKGGRGQTPFYGGLAAMDLASIPVTNAAGAFIGIAILRDMLAAYSLGMWLSIPFAMWRRDNAEVAYTAAGNAMYLLAMVPEMKSYWVLRQSGELQSMGTFKDFLYSYPAMQRAETVPASTLPRAGEAG